MHGPHCLPFLVARILHVEACGRTAVKLLLHDCISLPDWPAAGDPGPCGNSPQRGRPLPALEPQPQPGRWGILFEVALVDAAESAEHAPGAGLSCPA